MNWIAGIENGHLVLKNDREYHKFPVTKDGAAEYLNFITSNDIERVICSSTIDFPEEEGANPDILYNDFRFGRE